MHVNLREFTDVLDSIRSSLLELDALHSLVEVKRVVTDNRLQISFLSHLN